MDKYIKMEQELNIPIYKPYTVNDMGVYPLGVNNKVLN